MKNTAQNWAALIIGIALVLLGLIGFFESPIFGIFGVNVQQNLLHIITGVAFIWCARLDLGKAANVVLGLIYAIILCLAFITPLGMERLLSINGADNVLHLFVVIICLAFGFGME